MSRYPSPVPVRAGAGRVHIGIPAKRGYRVACWRTLTSARPVPIEEWEEPNGGACPYCIEVAEAARTLSELYRIAGWR